MSRNTVYYYGVFVCFMPSFSCAHDQHDFQTYCTDNSISCPKVVLLHPVFQHFVIDLWSDQSSARIQVSVRSRQFQIFIFAFLVLSSFVLNLGLTAMGLPFIIVFKNQLLGLICPVHQWIQHLNFTFLLWQNGLTFFMWISNRIILLNKSRLENRQYNLTGNGIYFSIPSPFNSAAVITLMGVIH
jgi:hypothetical protein